MSDLKVPAVFQRVAGSGKFDPDVARREFARTVEGGAQQLSQSEFMSYAQRYLDGKLASQLLGIYRAAFKADPKPKRPKYSNGRQVAEPGAQHVEFQTLQPGVFQSTPRNEIAACTPDDPTAVRDDLLNVSDEARAFGLVVASKDLRPPLSIGVLGKWGAGKTFFMRKVHDCVEEIAKGAGDGSPFHREIVQIRFNAWHYMETNLWASLVEYIFSELELWLRPADQEPASADLLDQLSTVRVLELQAAERLIVRAQARTQAEENLAAARLDYQQKQAKQDKATSSDIWVAAKKTLLEGPNGQARLEQVKAAGTKLGLGTLSDNLETLAETTRQLKDQSTRVATLRASMLRLVGDAWPWVAIFLVGVPVALIWLGHQVEALQGPSDLVVGLGGFCAAAAALMGRFGSIADQALGTVETFGVELQAVVDAKLSEDRELVEQAKMDLAAAQDRVDTARRELELAAEAASDAENEYRGATAKNRLNAFIRGNAASDKYARHLGVIASIREDFSQLAELMRSAESSDEQVTDHQHALALAQAEQARVVKLAQATPGVLTPEELESLKRGLRPKLDGKSFDRIILYIDDLDRCPADKVVEVLQAIHLLLFFPLFVCVVGVDARWVSRSLEERFGALLPSSATGSEDLDGRPPDAYAATAQDYLEKIFQVPYWVRGMSPAAGARFVRGIAGHRGDADPEVSESSGAGGMSETDDDADAAVSPSLAHENPAQSVGRPLELTRHEVELMAGLSQYLGGTPRRAIRFVNVYRILKASLTPMMRDRLVGADGEGLGYRALLAQLAIVTGLPDIASDYFRALALFDDGPLVDFVAGLREELGSAAAVIDFACEFGDRPVPRDRADLVDALKTQASLARRYSFQMDSVGPSASAESS